MDVQVQQRTIDNHRRIKAMLQELDRIHQAHSNEVQEAEARMAAMRQDFHGRIEEARNAEAAARRDVAQLQVSISQQLSDAERRVQQADARSHVVRLRSVIGSAL
jgi:Skp family chaperone for outer membrane proteins